MFWTGFRQDELAGWPGFGRIFLPGGRAPRAGEPFVQRELARSLRRIAEHGPRDFYEGGSALTAEDLRRTHATEEAPVALDYRALARPRFLLGRTFSDGRDTLKLEASVPDDTVARLEALGHQVSQIPANSPLAGQAGAIVIGDGGRIAGAHDPRSDGCALGL